MVVAKPGAPPYCDEHKGKWQSNKKARYKRNNYGPKWPAISKRQLRRYPFCACRYPNCGVCAGRHGVAKNVKATDVDHIARFRDWKTPSLAHQYMNLMSMCKPCHSSKTSREVRGIA